MKIIITGHSRGLGAAITAALLHQGHEVLALARHANPELQAAFPEQLEQYTLDLTNDDALQGWLRSGAAGRFLAGATRAALINNGGIVQPIGPPQSQDTALITQAIAVNVTAPLVLSAAFARIAAETALQDARILHISSGAGRQAFPGWSIYCATKAALDHHARVVALEQPSRVRISSIAPGVINTDMQSEIRATTVECFPIKAQFDDLLKNGQLSTPEDCASRLVNFLLSDHFGSEPVTSL